MSEYKVSKIMKLLHLEAKHGRRKLKNVYTSPHTSQYRGAHLYPKLSEEEKQQKIWSMDFTEERIQGKKIFTCAIISINSKIIVAHKFSFKNTSEFAQETLEEAIKKYGSPYMILTDRGSQFTSKLFREVLENHQIIHSMSRAYTSTDNAYIETFWKSLKVETGNIDDITLENYKRLINFYMLYYNHTRPHSGLNYYAPLEYAGLKRTMSFDSV